MIGIALTWIIAFSILGGFSPLDVSVLVIFSLLALLDE